MNLRTHVRRSRLTATAALLAGFCSAPLVVAQPEAPPNEAGEQPQAPAPDQSPPAEAEAPPPPPPPAEEAPREGEPPPADEAPPAEGEVDAEEEEEMVVVGGDEGSPSTYVQEDEDTIVVTVDRREKNIQKLSASAEAFSGEDLERKGITSMRELTAATPYVEIGAQEGNIEIYMRGIGTNNNTEIGDPAAATHFDCVYIPRPRGIGSMFFDVSRVEMQRGPQGTLRGRNATAGTINIISNAPELGMWAGNASFQYGNYAQRLTKTMVNIPIGEKLALRAATFTENREGFYTNKDGDWTIQPAENADTFAYRVSGKWAISDNVSLTIRHDNVRERGTGWVGSNFTEALQNGIKPEEVPNPRAVAFVGKQPSQRLDHLGVSAQLDVDFGPVGMEFVNSYRDMTYKQTTGTTNGVYYYGKEPGSLDRYNSSYWHTTSQSVVNELRFYSPDTDRFRWTVGGFNLYEEQYVLLAETADNSWGWAGQEYNHPDINDGAIAGYADATFDITDALRALAGIRVTHDYKERHGIGYGYAVGCEPGSEDTCTWGEHRFGTEGFRFKGPGRTDYTASNDVSDLLDGIDTFGERDTLDELLAQEGASAGSMTEQHGNVKNTFFDYRIGTEIDLTPDSMMYMTFSTGHKSGGFNDTITINGLSTAPTFDPEAVYALELGSKNVLLDRDLVLNGAGFAYAYEDYQASTVESFGEGDDAFRSSVRRNVGSATILGLEANAVAYLPKGFTGRVSMMLLDASFNTARMADTRESWNPDDQTIVNLKGNSLPRAPNLAISYGIEQNIPTSIGYFDWNVSGQTKTKQYMTVFNGEGEDLDGNLNPLYSDVVPTITRFDAGLGYTRQEGDIRLDAFITNITNMAYMTSLINAPGLNLRFFNPPRQFGLRLSMYL